MVRFGRMFGSRWKDDHVPLVDIDNHVVAIGWVAWACEQRCHFGFEQARYEFIGRRRVQEGNTSSVFWLFAGNRPGLKWLWRWACRLTRSPAPATTAQERVK